MPARTIPSLGRWEAEVEVISLFNLVVRDIESIVELSKIDLVLLPAACVLARSVFEISVKGARMMQPDDPFQREVRWLAHIREEARMHERIAAQVPEFLTSKRCVEIDRAFDPLKAEN